MAIVDGHGIPLAFTIHSASPAECRLAEETLQEIPDWLRPQKLIGDKAYDSRGLAQTLKTYLVDLVAPHLSNRKTKWQDGRTLRRYKRRWKVERFFAWLYNFRRLTTRWERWADNFAGFLHLASIIILLRHL
jgi:transposase